jgi:hypothetical protein
MNYIYSGLCKSILHNGRVNEGKLLTALVENGLRIVLLFLGISGGFGLQLGRLS